MNNFNTNRPLKNHFLNLRKIKILKISSFFLNMDIFKQTERAIVLTNYKKPNF